MKFSEYVKEFSINVSAFARKSGISLPTLNRILRGNKVTLDIAIEIVKFSKGKVTLKDLGWEKYSNILGNIDQK